jgi:DNA polymerase III subunit delta
MKLQGGEANRYFARPDPKRTGLLIYGADAMRVALKRQEVIAALVGPEGEAEMRLSRLPAGDLRKDPAQLLDAVKAQGFFPGPRVAFVEDATDTLAPIIKAALEDWRDGDAAVIVTAGQLASKSALRKLFEDHRNAYAVGIYDEPPSREEIESNLRAAGLTNIDASAMTDIVALSRDLDPGDFRQMLEKISLYKYQDTTPLTSEDVVACAPASIEAEVDDVLNIVAEGQSGKIGPVMRRLEGQGVNPVTLCIGATRHFRTLYVCAADPGGPQAGIGRMRPPVFGPRRDRILRQAQGWGLARLETALSMLVDTDLALRSSQRAPQMALMERTLIRLAMLGKR